ncbi:MAG: T9SS type A sorting domain-containing protein, partial [Bacteroidota bacterium]|nr:T9SS type A sorting domain-containing protein [Bacteroidota bacterium]
PSNGIFNINIFHPDYGIAEAFVTDLNGRILFSKQYEINMYSTQFNFNLAGYAKGIYILKVNLNGLSVSKKLIHF